MKTFSFERCDGFERFFDLKPVVTDAGVGYAATSFGIRTRL